MDFWLEPWLETVSQVCSAINLKINNCIVISHAVVPGAACIDGVKVLVTKYPFLNGFAPSASYSLLFIN